MKILGSISIAVLLLASDSFAQSSDTLRTQQLRTVEVRSARFGEARSLPDQQGTYLMAGRRTEVIRLADTDADVAQKNPRQLLARVPGVFVYDMDGSGNQINVATRGLDAHRSWEMNMRYNGVLTNSDMYGYPASHFSPPGESLERIELVRGTASLQYGAQFGGMLNMVSKQADTTRRFGFESIGSVGSYGLRSTYNAVGGRVGKLTYYGYAYWRHSDGYRQNSRSDAQALFASLRYQASSRLSLSVEVARSTYLYQIPGPLTDSMFRADPRQATRNRNYFSPDIWVPSVRADWQLTQRTRLQWITSAVLGVRNSVLIDAFATVSDQPDPVTNQYRQRQVDADHFNSYTSEVRLLHRFQVVGLTSTAVVGAQLMHNDLHRQQLGKGTTGSDYDMSLTAPFGRDLWYYTRNGAVFAEVQLQLTRKLTLSPGVRIERGLTRMRGEITSYDPGNVPNDISHQFTLLGVSGQYRVNEAVRLYGGWSQAYRPVIFKDIIPASTYEQVDKNLRDASGYNAELGMEGRWKGLHVNMSLFDVLYRNRMGTLVQTTATGQPYTFRTTIGDSRSQGVELLVEGQLMSSGRWLVSGFTSTALMDARYLNANVSAGTENRNVTGNQVESAPRFTSRNGLTFRYRTASLTAQYSYVGMTYSDALNTPVASANGAKGPVPAYGVWDLNATWRATSWLHVRGSVNNLLNSQYFTKRPLFYPGPGVWPSDGRNAVLSVGIKI
ncbi:TonB-dependent receptor family protein [uncultured Fibrella sp.]|uniref:TonB-dependent receptor family protein n=1 Tax=uncultured Fibrella sp. TaxID=1284596 RepID=UPI0035CB9875